MIDIEKLRSFYYVIKEGSLLKAAKVLDKNHTTLSKHLTELEETYKIKLFVRKRKRMELTQKGEELFKLAQSTIPNLENGAAEILEPKEQPNKLTIITTTGLNGIWLIRKIKRLLNEYPDLRISVITTNADVDFEKTKADLGILPKQSTKDLSHKKIRTLNHHLYASKEYLEKYGAPKNIDDLKNHKLISYYADFEGNIGNIDWHLKRGLPYHTMRESYLVINSGFYNVEAAIQGLGIIVLPDEYEYIKAAKLVQVLPKEHGPTFEYFFVMRSNVVPTSIQKRFLEILRDENAT